MPSLGSILSAKVGLLSYCLFFSNSWKADREKRSLNDAHKQNIKYTK